MRKRQHDIFLRGSDRQQQRTDKTSEQHCRAAQIKWPDISSEGLWKSFREPMNERETVRSRTHLMNFPISARHQVLEIRSCLRRHREGHQLAQSGRRALVQIMK